MTVYIALLRGIGPATHARMPLAELADRCTAAGLGDVIRVGTTGNLVFGSEQSQAAVEAKVSEAVKTFGSGVEVFTRTLRQLRKLVDFAPFPEAAAERPDRLGVCFF